jgi:uncharacterized protein (DUF1501 family)
MSIQRREFLNSISVGSFGLCTLGFGAHTPRFLLHAAENLRDEQGDRILVVVQLSGGNDGLNTIIPFEDDVYRKKRPTLAIAGKDAIKIDSETGFHPSLTGFANLLQQGQIGIVHGVGYPNPNRSHFESMDIWHSCQTKSRSHTSGWLGRFIEHDKPDSSEDVQALHLGGEQQPLALQSRSVRVPSVKSIDEFKLQGAKDGNFRQTVAQLAAANRDSTSDLLSFVQSSTSAALVASERVTSAQIDYKTSVDYPQTGLGKKLRIIAQLINAGLKTRIYYVTLDGFDTHSQQSDAHAALLREWGDAINAFVSDLKAHGQGQRVLTMSFSEFGRRVDENASKGTDHGAAAPVIFAGQAVKPGVFGKQPSLSDLVDGDLKFHTDFRQVYATILEKWLGCKSQDVIGEPFETLDILG